MIFGSRKRVLLCLPFIFYSTVDGTYVYGFLPEGGDAQGAYLRLSSALHGGSLAAKW
jgi:hypothetical protein